MSPSSRSMGFRPQRFIAFGSARLGETVGPLLAAGHAVHCVGLRALWLHPVRSLRDLRAFGPDVVITDHLSQCGVTAWIVSRILRVPFVIRLRGDVWAELRERQSLNLQGLVAGVLLWVDEGLLRRAALVLTVSPFLARVAGTHRLARVRSVPPAVRFNPQRDAKTAEQPFVLTVTNFDFRAKVAPLVPYAAALAPVLRERLLTWRIIGGGLYLQSIARRIQDISCSDIVLIEGHSADVRPAMTKAISLLHFSEMDAYPLVVIEAMASGLPVIATAGVGMLDQIVDGESGLLVKSPAQAPEALRAILDSTSLRQRLIDEGLRFAATHVPEVVGQRLSAEIVPILCTKVRHDA